MELSLFTKLLEFYYHLGRINCDRIIDYIKDKSVLDMSFHWPFHGLSSEYKYYADNYNYTFNILNVKFSKKNGGIKWDTVICLS